jgi:hypothetical protein
MIYSDIPLKSVPFHSDLTWKKTIVRLLTYYPLSLSNGMKTNQGVGRVFILPVAKIVWVSLIEVSICLENIGWLTM